MPAFRTLVIEMMRFIQLCSLLVLVSMSLPANAFKVLFVGNSFVGYSKSTLQRFAQASPLGDDQFGYEFVGGISLEEHSRRASTLSRVKSEQWDYVVLQDHSLQTIRHSKSFYTGVETMIKAVRASGAEPILFMTWARLQSGNYPGDQPIVTNAYLDAAAKHGVAVARVGDLFFEKYRNDRDLFFRMYDPDGIHPTSFGTFATAVSIYSVMYDDNLSWVPTSGVGSAGDRLRSSARKINVPRKAHYNGDQSAAVKALPAQMLELLLE